ncbi:MAG: UbiA family prenyltransferase [Alphaproteobacteria bacterium]|nr:UbiA family prenyltransferase [Alphaproteobacteria bacterium]
MDDPIRIPIAAVPAAIAGLERPLVVDLDGSLVHSDTTLEAFLAASRSPLALIRAIWALRDGRAAFKRQLAAAVTLNPAHLPYNAPLLTYLRAEHAAGRALVLATGADRATADAVADHLRLFDRVLASDGQTNMTGKNKLAAISRYLDGAPFTYIGNSGTDLGVWCGAAGAICVNARPKVVRAAAMLTTVEREFSAPPGGARLLLRAMRPHQWVKNLLVFVPLVAAHAIGDIPGWLAAIAMFVAFCCAASAIYLANDLTDLAADRRHPTKMHRPFASGVLPLPIGLIAAPLLMLLGIALSLAAGAFPTLLAYGALSVGYSLWLKTQPLVDVFALAALYGLRLLAGGAASGYPVSLWLLAFSSFLFLGLALIKRVAELMALPPGAMMRAAGRGYRAGDLPILQLMGVASSFVASMVLALYVQSELASAAGRQLTPSWIIVPAVLFWECRMWLVTARGEMHDDPVVYAARDWVSWFVAIGCFAVLLFDRLIGT